ncbi:MAG: hypothetical protein U1F43_08065 [Myxococcota bacterium]
MAERAKDLEIFRQNFLHQLKESTPQLQGHQDFVRYWKAVEGEASHTEDLSKLDGWVRDLARDKDEVQAMKLKIESMDERDPMAEQLLNILRMLLEFLGDIERKIRRLRDDRRNYLAALLWKAGPGTKPREEGDDEKKDEKKGDQAVTAALDKTQKDGAAKAPEIKEQTKKMQR